MEQQANNPLHGKKLKDMLEEMVDFYGWDGLGERIEVNCFLKDPSVNSSLKFLRRTPWARTRVEGLYMKMLRVQADVKRLGY